MEKMKIKKLVAILLAVVLLATLPSGLTTVTAKTVKVKKITLNKKSLQLDVGESVKLKIKKVKPSKASKKVKWKSSNTNVAVVSKKGVVIAKGSGIVNITATSTKYKKVKAVCKITVKEKKVTVTNPTEKINREETTTVSQKLQGDKGDKGDKGEKGDKGDKGEQGVGIENVYIDENNDLIIILTDGRIINAGNIGTANKPTTKKYTVVFKDYDGKVIKTEEVEEGKAATPPENPVRTDGYVFSGWDKTFDNVTQNMEIMSQYTQISGLFMSANKVEVEPGSKDVKIALSVNNNPGILGMTLSVKYNQKCLTLKNAENGTAVKDVLTMTRGAILQRGCKFIWDGQDISDAQIKDGEVLILTFDVPENTPSGIYDIDFVYDEGDIVDRNLNPLSLSVKSGSIVVK